MHGILAQCAAIIRLQGQPFPEWHVCCYCGAAAPDNWNHWVKFCDSKKDRLLLDGMGIWRDLKFAWEGKYSLMAKYCADCMKMLVDNIKHEAGRLKRDDDQTSVMKRVILHGLREQIKDKLDAQ